MSERFVYVEVESCEGSEDGVSLRFKLAPGAAIEPARRVRYVCDDGLEGFFLVEGVSLNARGEEVFCEATQASVEDSSEGTVRLLWGAERGLRLRHEESGALRREPYLLLSLTTPVE